MKRIVESYSKIKLEQVTAVVKEAAVMALELSKTAVHELKPDKTYVTNVDRQVENFLESELKALYPEISFLGEEYGLRGDVDGMFWAADPIDGTTNFVLGSPMWTVSIGLMCNKEPALGVIALPCADEIYSAKKGEGAFCNGIPFTTPDNLTEPERETPLCVTTRGCKYFNLSAWSGVIRSYGSICAELVLTAKGASAGMVGFTYSLHDIAGGTAIALEAGCTIQNCDGTPFDFMQIYHEKGSKKPFIIAPPNMSRWLMKNLAPKENA